MIQRFDLGGKNFLAGPMKALKDEERIANFFETKRNYYKNLGPRE